MYRYGHANVQIREALRVCKYLTVAWSGTLTMTGDSPNGKMFQENSFILAFGPDDFKLNIGYDWVRQQTYFAFVVAMDTKGSSVEFEKMEIMSSQIQMIDITLNKAKEFGKIIYGYGNDGRTEGARNKNLLFTNALGPVLVKNPWLTEYLINLALKNKGLKEINKKIDFDLELKSLESAKDFINKKIEKERGNE